MSMQSEREEEKRDRPYFFHFCMLKEKEVKPTAFAIADDVLQVRT